MRRVDGIKGLMRVEDAEIYAKYADELVCFATVLVGPSWAEDVVSAAVASAFRAAAWPEVAHPRAYLFRATLNRAHQTRRADRRRERRELSSAVAEHAEVPYVRIEVLDAMRLLSLRQRAVIFFTYWQDLECGEVARLLQVSTRTVQRELSTARRHLEVLLR